MLNPQKTLEREALLKRIRELDAEIAQHERNLSEGEALLPSASPSSFSRPAEGRLDHGTLTTISSKK
jgi:hypothetical protein